MGHASSLSPKLTGRSRRAGTSQFALHIRRRAHTQNPPIIFRDVKPANIMIMPNGLVKLIDFGIARTYKEGKRRDTMSMGTAAYAPFEQFGKGQAREKSGDPSPG